MKAVCLSIIVTLVAGVTFLSCSRSGAIIDDGGGGDPHVFNPIDTTAPVLIIHTPAINQVFSTGTAISVTGRISDDFGLYRGTLRIVNDATGAVVVNQPYEIHGVRTYEFSLPYTTNVSVMTDFNITISFEDHGLNFATKTVKVKVEP